MNRKSVGIILSMFALAVAPAFAQTVGVFDMQADWSLDDGTKVAGSADFADGVYSIRGNGADIWGTADEGFYLYTEKPDTESWVLSGKVSWVDIGGANDWAKAGPMIRNDAQSPSAENIFLPFRGLQDFVAPQHREAPGKGSDSGRLVNQDTAEIINPGQGGSVYLRVGYWAPLGIVYGEGSLDGETWYPTSSSSFDFVNGMVAYGFAVTNHENNDLLGEIAVEDLVFEELTTPPAFINQPGVGEFDAAMDVGPFSSSGSSSYDEASDVYTLRGVGTDIWGTADRMHMLYKNMTGSFEAEVDMFHLVTDTDDWTRAGMMVRDDISAGAAGAIVQINSPQDNRIQYRISEGDATSNGPTVAAADTTGKFRLVKIGSTVQNYYQDAATNEFVLNGEINLDLKDDEFIFALAASAHNETLISESEFTGLTITEYPYEVLRSIAVSEYFPGQTLTVTITVNVREGESISSLVIEEMVPPEAESISSITGGGTLAGDTITWELSDATGSQTLSYDIVAPSNINIASINWGDSSTSGAGFDLIVAGPTQLGSVTFNGSETFAYLDGEGDWGREGDSLIGLGGGFGWGDGNVWTQVGEDAESFTLNRNTLDAGLSLSQPTEFNPGNFSLEISGQAGNGASRMLPALMTGGELWVSYTFREEADPTDVFSGIAFYDSAGGEVSFIGKPWGAEFLGIGNLPAGGDVLTDVPYNVNNHILVRIVVAGAASEVYMWVNPDKQDRLDTYDAMGADDINEVAEMRLRRGNENVAGTSAFYDNIWVSSVPALPPAGAGRVDLQIDNPDRDPALPAWDVISVDQVDDALVGVPGFGHDNGEDHYLIVSGYIYFNNPSDPTTQVVAFGLPFDRMSGLNGHILGAFNNAIEGTGLKNAMKFENNAEQAGPFTFELDPPGNYEELRSAQTVANGDGQLFATLNYADGSTEDTFLNSDDWYNDGGEISFEGIRQLVDGMNRLQGGDSNFDTRFDPAVFEKTIAVDSSKELVSITLEYDPSVDDSASFNLFDIWATPAGGTSVNDWSLY